VDKNRFRKDLYYRLSTFQIEIPPLSERKDDIMTLINHFIKNISERESSPTKILSSEAMEALENYNWPGNVRELQNLINRAYFLCPANTITLSDLPLPVSSNTNLISSNFVNLSYKIAREKLLEKFDVEYLSYYLKKNNGNITKTANDCGIDRRSIHRLINKHKLIYKNV
jgi:DNA-binding NtrC family response regulator